MREESEGMGCCPVFPSEGGDNGIRRVIGQGRGRPLGGSVFAAWESEGSPYGIGPGVVQELTGP